MESAVAGDPSLQPLGLNFRKVQAQYNAIESSDLSGSDPELQRRLREALALCEVALMQVVHLDVFSKNEVLEDVNTGDMKLLLLGFYRAEMLLRLVDSPPDQEKRIGVLQEALAGLRGFLGDLKRLEALPKVAKESWDAMEAEGIDQGSLRQQKIARMKASKAARERMAVLAEKIGAQDPDEDTDELEREQMLLLIETCCHTSLDSIRSTGQELDMLQQIAKMRRPDGSLPPESHDVTPSANGEGGGLKMMTLLPQTVARMGDPNRDPSSRLSYATAMRQLHTGVIPGLYTMSVEEGLREEEAQRAMAEAKRMEEASARADARQAEEDEDEDSESARRRLIAQDAYRENHTRGAGNRKNRS